MGAVVSDLRNDGDGEEGEGNSIRTALAAVLVDIEAVWVVVGMRSRLDESIAHFSRKP